jgi:hypothetical protein
VIELARVLAALERCAPLHSRNAAATEDAIAAAEHALGRALPEVAEVAR